QPCGAVREPRQSPRAALRPPGGGHPDRMTGCLTFPLKVAATLVLLVVLAVGWFYREEIVRVARLQLGMPELPSRVGLPDAGGAERARVRMDSLVRSRADSVVLSAGEM